MGSVGDAYDNALCESFFASLECELLDRYAFKSQSEARLAVFRYIEAGTTRTAVTQPSTTSHQSTTKGSTLRLSPQSRMDSSEEDQLQQVARMARFFARFRQPFGMEMPDSRGPGQR